MLGYEIIGLGSDTPLVLMDAIKHIEELMGKKFDLRFLSVHPAYGPFINFTNAINATNSINAPNAINAINPNA